MERISRCQHLIFQHGTVFDAFLPLYLKRSSLWWENVCFVFPYLSKTAAIWWINAVNNESVPASWTEFRNAGTPEFAPADHVRRAWNRLRRLQQSNYFFYFSSGIQKQCFDYCWSAKRRKDRPLHIRSQIQCLSEVVEVQVHSFEGYTCFALRVDRAIWIAGRKSQRTNLASSSLRSSPTLVNIENERSGTIYFTAAQHEQKTKI